MGKRGGSWERAEHYGRELGIIVWREWEKIKPVPSSSFSYHVEEIEPPAEERTKGGYEASVSFYGKTLGRMVLEGAVRGAARLKE